MNNQVGAFKLAGNFETFAKFPKSFYTVGSNGNGWEHFAKNHIAFDLDAVFYGMCKCLQVGISNINKIIDWNPSQFLSQFVLPKFQHSPKIYTNIAHDLISCMKSWFKRTESRPGF